jgi:cytoskeletal protein CcmA (bactofilin family)
MSNTGSETTHIAKSTVIKGEVRLEGPATIAGKVEGNIHGKEVEIVQDANIEGDIACGSVELNGNVKGNVTASKSCKLGATARVAGEIRTANLGIAEGATFTGQVIVGPTGAPKSESSEASSTPNRIEAMASEESSSTSGSSGDMGVVSSNVQNSMNRPKVQPRPYANGGVR